MVKGKSKKTVRNGKVYISGWIDKDLENLAQKVAKKDKRNFTSFLELAISNQVQMMEKYL